MEENQMLDNQELFGKVAEQARLEGINNEEAYNTFVETVINNMIRDGELDSDNDTQALVEGLKSRYPEYIQSLDKK